MMNWKEIAKKWPLLYWINAKLKCFYLKRDLARLSSEYQKKVTNYRISYSAGQAVTTFKSRHKLKNPNFVPVRAGSLKIFWVGANRNQDESGFIQALKRLGKVNVFYNIKGLYGSWGGDAKSYNSNSFEETRKANDESLLNQVLLAHAEGCIDVLIGQMWAHRFSKEALVEVQSLGIPIINISMDDRLPENWLKKGDVRLGSVGLSDGVDLVLTTSAETCLWYSVEKCPAIFWPLASSPEIFSPTKSMFRDIDVLFIGNKYGARGKIIQYIRKCGVNVSCYGRGWSNGYVNAAQMAHLSKRARIILGIGLVGHCQDIYTLKLRDFDALMSGALYLTHRNPDLCKLFLEGEEIEYYRTPEEAFKKIRFYLDHPANLKRVAMNGHEKSLSHHTWYKRLSETFEKIGLLKT
jgi:spore maturation protein CgeB